MKPAVVHGARGMPATQDGSVELWPNVPVEMMKYPCMLPVIPAFTVPGGLPSVVSHDPGLNPAFVTKLPFLNCWTTVYVPSWFERTVKWRSKVSSAQSLPQVPESGDPLGYGP